ncbi:hypothetical protein [Acinetobacter baumannii]|uniref:hypothetical protein n=1 Tax=Acinetobacter baumannii TaxID=470 RepID=UPI0035CCEFAD
MKSKAQALPIQIINEIQSWVAVKSFAVEDAHPDLPIIDANELAEFIDKLVKGKPGAEQPSALEQVLKIHEEILETNSYCYFELAYTRVTDWMVWICSNAREADPNRKVLLRGQGLTPEEAAQNAINNQLEN